jgi:hypothetical protein
MSEYEGAVMRTVALSALTLAALAIAPRAQAVEPLDVFSARIGGYVTSWDTKVRADGETSRGTQVDLDKDFGLDNSPTIGFVGVTWRPWDHHEFGLTYYQDSSSASRQVNRDIEFRDQTYPVNSVVSAEVSVDAYEAYYVWWAGTRENWAIGPRVGMIWYSLDMKLALQVDANGNQVGGGRRSEASADLPTITLGGAWRWTPGGRGLLQGQRGQRGWRRHLRPHRRRILPVGTGGVLAGLHDQQAQRGRQQDRLHRQLRFRRQRVEARVRLPLVT